MSPTPNSPHQLIPLFPSPPPNATVAGPTSRTPDVPGLAIIDTVARGGQGTVYVAHQSDHDRIVALKVLDAPHLDEATSRRFDRERIALGRLSDHPCIVTLIDSGYATSGEPYLVLEYAPGGSLSKRLGSGPLGFEEATRLAVCLSNAIKAAHSAGIVHRDIKPANVVRSAYGDWMLADFGIAALVDSEMTETIQATYAHAAPETFEGVEITATADLYSLASVLATCLTGREPFAISESEGVGSTLRRIGEEPYPDLHHAGVPYDMAAFLGGALSKDPSQRPQSAAAFGSAVNELRSAHGLTPVPVRTEHPSFVEPTVVVDDEHHHDQHAGPHAEHGAPETGSIRRRAGRALTLQAALVAVVVAAAALLWSGLGSGSMSEILAAASLTEPVVAIDDDISNELDGTLDNDQVPTDVIDTDAPTDEAAPGDDDLVADDGDGNANNDGDGNGNGNGNNNNGNGNGDGGNGPGGNGPGGNGPGGNGPGGNGPGGNGPGRAN